MTGDLFVKKGTQSICCSEIIVFSLDCQGHTDTHQVSHKIAVQVVLNSTEPSLHNTFYVYSMFYFKVLPYLLFVD